jgi:hypothetical protein
MGFKMNWKKIDLNWLIVIVELFNLCKAKKRTKMDFGWCFQMFEGGPL